MTDAPCVALRLEKQLLEEDWKAMRDELHALQMDKERIHTVRAALSDLFWYCRQLEANYFGEHHSKKEHPAMDAAIKILRDTGHG